MGQLTPRSPAKAGAQAGDSRLAKQRRIKINPVKIPFLDPLYLPRALPFLNLQFPPTGFLQIVICIEPDQQFAAFVLGEPIDDALTMLIDSLDQVAGAADINRSFLRLAIM